MVHDLNPKNLHITGLFFCKIQKPVLGHYPQNEIFEKFQENPMSRFGKNAFT